MCSQYIIICIIIYMKKGRDNNPVISKRIDLFALLRHYESFLY
jgi:hypothetical protein